MFLTIQQSIGILFIVVGLLAIFLAYIYFKLNKKTNRLRSHYIDILQGIERLDKKKKK